MKIPIYINNEKYMAETAAISCVRYRTLYGVSPLGDVAADTSGEFMAKLARMVWAMIQPCEIEFVEFAKACAADKDFTQKAVRLRGELLKLDDSYEYKPTAKQTKPDDFDELDILARMALVGLPADLLYELPLFHLISTINRTVDLKNPDKDGSTWTEMDPSDVSKILGA